jgi:putative modified peptide
MTAFKPSAETIEALLDKLGSDDTFRDLFQRDPRAALASVGHAEAKEGGPAEGLWACCATQQLASKEQIRASRQKLRAQLLAEKASYHPITLESSAKS